MFTAAQSLFRNLPVANRRYAACRYCAVVARYHECGARAHVFTRLRREAGKCSCNQAAINCVQTRLRSDSASSARSLRQHSVAQQLRRSQSAQRSLRSRAVCAKTTEKSCCVAKDTPADTSADRRTMQYMRICCAFRGFQT